MKFKIKTFDFPSFEEWFSRRFYFNTKLGKYTAHIKQYFPTVSRYQGICYDIGLTSYDFFEFNDETDINNPEKIEQFKTWYYDTCSKLNQDLENHIYKTYFNQVN